MNAEQKLLDFANQQGWSSQQLVLLAETILLKNKTSLQSCNSDDELHEFEVSIAYKHAVAHKFKVYARNSSEAKVIAINLPKCRKLFNEGAPSFITVKPD